MHETRDYCICAYSNQDKTEATIKILNKRYDTMYEILITHDNIDLICPSFPDNIDKFCSIIEGIRAEIAEESETFVKLSWKYHSDDNLKKVVQVTVPHRKDSCDPRCKQKMRQLHSRLYNLESYHFKATEDFVKYISTTNNNILIKIPKLAYSSAPFVLLGATICYLYTYKPHLSLKS